MYLCILELSIFSAHAIVPLGGIASSSSSLSSIEKLDSRDSSISEVLRRFTVTMLTTTKATTAPTKKPTPIARAAPLLPKAFPLLLEAERVFGRGIPRGLQSRHSTSGPFGLWSSVADMKLD